MRPSRNDYMRAADLFESSWEEIDRASFIALWTQEAETLRQKVDTETLRLATGLLLPIWSALPSDHLAVNRTVAGAGRSWLGRLVFDDHVLRLFSALGIDRKETLPASAHAKADAAVRSIDVTHPFPPTNNRSIDRTHVV